MIDGILKVCCFGVPRGCRSQVPVCFPLWRYDGRFYMYMYKYMICYDCYDMCVFFFVVFHSEVGLDQWIHGNDIVQLPVSCIRRAVLDIEVSPVSCAAHDMEKTMKNGWERLQVRYILGHCASLDCVFGSGLLGQHLQRLRQCYAHHHPGRGFRLVEH